jgi:hypothetical protein
MQVRLYASGEVITMKLQETINLTSIYKCNGKKYIKIMQVIFTFDLFIGLLVENNNSLNSLNFIKSIIFIKMLFIYVLNVYLDSCVVFNSKNAQN